MYIKDTFVDKAVEGKTKVLELGVYILETLGAVGLPADQVTALLVRFGGPGGKPGEQEGGVQQQGEGGAAEAASKKKKKRKVKKRKRRRADKTRENMLVRKRREEAALQRHYHDKQHNKNYLFQRTLRFLIEARSSSPQQVISRILFYLADALGESLDHPSKRDLERAVDLFVEEAHVQRGSRVQMGNIPKPLSRAVTGVVLSYQEREDLQLPSSAQSRIRRGMHFDIPIRPFDATVQLLPAPCVRDLKQRRSSLQLAPEQQQQLDSLQGSMQQESHQMIKQRRVTVTRCGSGDGDGESPTSPSSPQAHDQALVAAGVPPPPSPRRGTGTLALRESAATLSEQQVLRYHEEIEEQDLVGRMMANAQANEHVIPCTPQSFPPTPESRTALLGDFSEFTENVLWRARDELRGQEQHNERVRMAILNPEDAHPKVLLNCGGHCASLDPRSCDGVATGPAPHRERIYRSVRAALSFQHGRTTYFEICPMWSGPEAVEPDAGGAPATARFPLHLCVGVSTKQMSLRNTVPGCSPHSVGLDSSGVLLLAGRRTRASAFSYGSVIGVCVRAWASHISVAFFVDGRQVVASAHNLGVDVADHDQEEFKDTLGVFSMRADPDAAPLEYLPTLSIKSRNVKAFAHFSAMDMRHPPDTAAAGPRSPYWAEIAQFVPGEPVFALDGTLLLHDDPAFTL
ncbi:Uncharacterized protein SCF082_LOCUS24837 [Durusdinium trenchii]|uniref:Uncharacterized protein n=1 Tax=Durusdinium trenchii TaxID=1381693 RepID=A0ABP0LY88_9DINO